VTAAARPQLHERPDQRLVHGVVPAGTAPLVGLNVSPAHPSNAVVLVTRRRGATAQRSRLTARSTPTGAEDQWFSGTLPALIDGEAVDYRVELMRAGQQVASLPADGTWLTVTTAEPPPAPARVESTWSHQWEFFATFDAFGRVAPIGDTPQGYRIDFFIEHGTVTGPGIAAEIQPGGGDWLCIRRDGVAVLDIRAAYRTADGPLTGYRAGGLLDLGPDGHARAVTGQLHGTPPCWVTPTFQTADPAWQWLNRVQGFGIGRVLLDEARVRYDVHLPRPAGERPADA
jgi:hypothetical protein